MGQCILCKSITDSSFKTISYESDKYFDTLKNIDAFLKPFPVTNLVFNIIIQSVFQKKWAITAVEFDNELEDIDQEDLYNFIHGFNMKDHECYTRLIKFLKQQNSEKNFLKLIKVRVNYQNEIYTLSIRRSGVVTSSGECEIAEIIINMLIRTERA